LIEGENLLTRATRPGRLDPAIASLLGETLARCHHGMVDVLRYGNGERPAFPSTLPATLSAARFDPALRVRGDSDGQREVAGQRLEKQAQALTQAHADAQHQGGAEKDGNWGSHYTDLCNTIQTL